MEYYECLDCNKRYKTIKAMRNCINKHEKKNIKKKISPQMRELVWNTYIGQKTEYLCFCCNNKRITPFTNVNTFQAGHILSESNGGKIELGNLLPICKKCNINMGKMHWDDFVKKKKFFIRVFGDNIPEIHIQAAILIQNKYRKFRFLNKNRLIKNKEKTKNIKKNKKRKNKKKKRKRQNKTNNFMKPTFSSLMKRKLIIY